MNYKLLIVLILICNSCTSSKKIRGLSPIVAKAKETSLYKNQIDWEKINQKYVQLTKDKKTIVEKKEGYQFLVNSMKDKHATIRSAKDFSILASYRGDVSSKEEREIDKKFFNKIINDVEAKFSYQKLGDNIGLLKVVGIGPGDVKKQAEEIREGLIELKREKVDKWIVDLRYNGGGNMEPMISGLAPLIGEGKIGGSVNLNNITLSELNIKDSQFFNFGRLACEMENRPTINSDEKVVVLLSRYTVSSGEMVAITFKGRPNTIFIGEGSGGLTTANGFDLIDEEVYLVISQGIFSDRNNVAYRERVEVDEYLEFDEWVKLEDDKQVQRAIDWLNKH